jgi:excisionase family DNA binding protein
MASSVANRPESPWLTVSEAADYLRVGKGVVYALIRRSRLRAARIAGGRTYRTKRDWCDEYAESCAPVEIAR